MKMHYVVFRFFDEYFFRVKGGRFSCLHRSFWSPLGANRCDRGWRKPFFFFNKTIYLWACTEWQDWLYKIKSCVVTKCQRKYRYKTLAHNNPDTTAHAACSLRSLNPTRGFCKSIIIIKYLHWLGYLNEL